MHQTEILAIILAFFVSVCFSRIAIETSQSDGSGLTDAAVKILESCYGNNVAALGLAGNLTGAISKKLWSRGSFSTTLIDASTRRVNNGPVNPISRHKLQVFVVSASSQISLMTTLVQIKLSTWWNHMANFLILDWPPSNHGCSDAFKMLWSAWEMNIMNAKFMCHHRTYGRLIYTFNPYTSQAPSPWELDNIYSGKNDHPWSLFVRLYEEGEGVCNELDFDKTSDLGGYEIRISVTDEMFGIEDNETERFCVGYYEDLACNVLFPALNITPKLLVHHSLNSVGYIDRKGNPHGILAELFNGLSDICLMIRYLTSLPNVTISYPPWLNELRSLTHYSGYKSQLSKICSVIDSNSRVGLCLVCLINIFLFTYFLRESMTEATLSTLRIICNASLLKIPGNLASRIYLGSLFFFALTMQGIYQGQLASLLSKQDPLRNVNSMSDLAELDHTIYGSTTYHMHFGDPAFDNRYVETKGLTCTEHVLDNPGAACVSDKGFLIYDAVKYKLHMSRDTLTPMFGAFPLRPDWPLEQKINRVIMRAVETYQVQYLHENMTHETYRLIEFQENQYIDQSVKILTLEQLSFAFAILGIGLGCATISFSIEVGFTRASFRTKESPNSNTSAKLIRFTTVFPFLRLKSNLRGGDAGLY